MTRPPDVVVAFCIATLITMLIAAWTGDL